MFILVLAYWISHQWKKRMGNEELELVACCNKIQEEKEREMHNLFVLPLHNVHLYIKKKKQMWCGALLNSLQCYKFGKIHTYVA